MVKFGVKKLVPGAHTPTKAHDDDACWDLYACEHAVLHPVGHEFYGPVVVKSGIAIDIPPGWEVQVRPRSGMAAKYGITIVNAPGSVDAGYQGDVSAILANLGRTTFVVTPGMRIAQLAFRPVPQIELVEVDELISSARGTNGFGSSGK